MEYLLFVHSLLEWFFLSIGVYETVIGVIALLAGQIHTDATPGLKLFEAIVSANGEYVWGLLVIPIAIVFISFSRYLIKNGGKIVT